MTHDIDILFPDQLRMVNGKLVLKDGRDAAEYLKAWADDQGIPPDMPLILGPREQAVRDYQMARAGFNSAA